MKLDIPIGDSQKPSYLQGQVRALCKIVGLIVGNDAITMHDGIRKLIEENKQTKLALHDAEDRGDHIEQFQCANMGERIALEEILAIVKQRSEEECRQSNWCGPIQSGTIPKIWKDVPPTQSEVIDDLVLAVNELAAQVKALSLSGN